jgi:molybdate transport system substrate-binding protein
MRDRAILIVGVLAAAAGCQGDKVNQPAPAVRVAAAADLLYAFDDLSAAFRDQHPGIAVHVSFGSSGDFFGQISSGAPFDLYLSANTEYPHKLIEQHSAVGGSEFVYAVGRLVVWVPAESKLNLDKLGVRAAAEPGVRKVAIANPRHAPYGRAAQAALKHFDVYDQVKDRLAFAENVSQAAQFVESGAADVGLIALSLAVAPPLKDRGRYAEVTADAYPPLKQGGVILTGARDVKSAELFRGFLMSADGQAILAKYGFRRPGG